MKRTLQLSATRFPHTHTHIHTKKNTCGHQLPVSVNYGPTSSPTWFKTAVSPPMSTAHTRIRFHLRPVCWAWVGYELPTRMKSKETWPRPKVGPAKDPSHGEFVPPWTKSRPTTGYKLQTDPSFSGVAAIASVFPARLNFTALLLPYDAFKYTS